jgi:WD40 repeat protein
MSFPARRLKSRLTTAEMNEAIPVRTNALVAALLMLAALRAEEPRRDRFGDPLPQGAIARLGTVHAHPSVETIAFSADGKTIITTSRHVVRHWDAATGRVIKVIERPMPRDARDQRISADGRTAAVLWKDRLEIRDVVDNRLRHSIPVPPYEDVTAFLFSPHGNAIVIAFESEGNVRAGTLFVRADSGQANRWPGVTFSAGVLSTNGDRLATIETANGKPVLRCRDARGKQLFQFSVTKDTKPRTFSPDGRSLLTQDAIKEGFVLYDVVAGVRRADEFPKTHLFKPAVAYSPDGRFMALRYESDVTLWDPKAKNAIQTLKTQAGHLAFSPDGMFLAGSNELTHCWAVETGKLLWPGYGPIVAPTVELESPLLSQPVDTLIATYEFSRAQVWNWTTGRPLPMTPVWLDSVARMWPSADGKRLYATYGELYCGAWDIATGKQIRRSLAVPEDLLPEPIIRDARAAQDGRTFAAVIVDAREMGAVWTLWETDSGKQIDRRPVTISFPDYVRIAPGERYISDREILIDVITGRRQLVVIPPRGFEVATPPAFTPDRRLCVAHSRPEVADIATELVVYETTTSKPLMRHTVGPRQIVQAALSPDDRWLAMAGEQKIELWDLATGKLAAELKHHTPDVPYDAAAYCTDLMFLPGRKLIAAYGDRTALVWEMPAGTEKAPPQRMSDRTWDDLASMEPRAAQDAVWALVNEPAKAIAMLRERLKPAAAIVEADITALLADLAGDNFARREAAGRRLRELGHGIEKPLEAALAKAANAEQSRRLKALLDACRDDGPMSADERRALRAIQALGLIATPDARKLLEAWAKGVDGAKLTSESKAALERLR